MAEKRMYSKKITETDDFLSLPLSTQALYFHLGMNADDDGFVSSPVKVMRMIGANKNELDLLLAKRYLIPFGNGVVVIRHWRINNYLRSDRYTPTLYVAEKGLLVQLENGSYELKNNIGIPLVDQMDTQVSIDKDSSDKDSIDKGKVIMCDDIQVATTPQFKTIITILLNDGSEYEVKEDYFEQMKKLFPGVDVMTQLRNMSAWAINNPTKRKTKSGIKKFIGNWLSSEQDKGVRNRNKETTCKYSKDEFNSLFDNL